MPTDLPKRRPTENDLKKMIEATKIHMKALKEIGKLFARANVSDYAQDQFWFDMQEDIQTLIDLEKHVDTRPLCRDPSHGHLP